VTAKGSTLTVYISAPAGYEADPALTDIVEAEKLAFAAHAAAAQAHFHLRLRVLDAAKVSDNARTAIQDASAIAYLGELIPGSSAATIGITNALDLLQVSPSDTALELTQRTPAIPGAPKSYCESLSTYGKTFARVVPNSAREARADAAELARLGVHSVYITGDGSPYSRAFAYALRHDLPAGVHTQSSASGAGAVFYTGVSTATAVRDFQAAATASPGAVLFATSPVALQAGGLEALPASAADRLYVSQPGFVASARSTPSAERAFAAAFARVYGHAPSTEAVFGYEAMSAVLRAIEQAGAHANDRATVIRDFFGLRVSSSVLGSYSIDAGGDTSIESFVLDRLRAGRLVATGTLSP
jgi:branched-chain amino acid transport system substrate-binding protein